MLVIKKTVVLTTLEGSIKNVLQFNPINLHVNSGNTTEELDDVTGVVKSIITFYLQIKK
jgi:hypothetical protein